MSWQWELVHHHEFITEGPVWDGRFLFYSEIGASRTWRYDPGSGERVVWREHTRGANGMLRAPGGGLLACEGAGRRVVRYVADAPAEVIADRFEGKQFNEPNDLAQAGGGRIWFSDPNYGGRRMQLDHESVYCVDPGGAARRVTCDTNRPNGVLLNADESELYVAESPHRLDQRRQLRAYPIAADGCLGEHRVLHDFAYDEMRAASARLRRRARRRRHDTHHRGADRGHGRAPRARPRADGLRVRSFRTGGMHASVARRPAHQLHLRRGGARCTVRHLRRRRAVPGGQHRPQGSSLAPRNRRLRRRFRPNRPTLGVCRDPTDS